MTTISENALQILRLMQENRFTLKNPVSQEQLMALSSLDVKDFEDAQDYLSELKLIETLGFGENGLRSINSSGVIYIQREMQNRTELSLTAEQVLRYIAKAEPGGNYDGVRGVTIQKVEEELGLNHELCVKAFHELEDNGFVRYPVEGSTSLKWGVVTTREGRQALRQNFKKEQFFQASVGQIFNAPITATNVVNAVNSSIEHFEQIGSQNDPAVVRLAVTELLTQLVNEATKDMELRIKAEFTAAVVALQNEFDQPSINPSSIHQKIIGILTFGDSLGGTLNLGVLIAPYIPVLYNAAQNLFNT